MGEVYLVEQLSLGMKRALKVIKAGKQEGGTESLGKRFRREAMVLSRLSHDSIVQVIDFGQLSESEHFLVMEFVEGVNAQSSVDHQGPLDLTNTVEALRQLASALAYAHGQGIVHRDLKPANILLRSRKPVSLRIVDFGMVRIVTDETLTKLTAEEQIIGTPRFMAPEQCRCMEVGPAADIYALGGVGFFLFSGTAVFSAKSILEVIASHALRPPDRLSARCPNRFVPPALDRLLESCLAKRPEDRPTAQEVFEALEVIAHGLPDESIAPTYVPEEVSVATEELTRRPADNDPGQAPVSLENVLDLASLIWQVGDAHGGPVGAVDLASNALLEGLFNQISNLLVDLAGRLTARLEGTEPLRAQLDRIREITNQISDMEMDLALLDSDVGAGSADEATLSSEARRLDLQERIGQQALTQHEQYRRLFELVLSNRDGAEDSQSLRMYSDLERIVEQFLRLRGATVDARGNG